VAVGAKNSCLRAIERAQQTPRVLDANGRHTAARWRVDDEVVALLDGGSGRRLYPALLLEQTVSHSVSQLREAPAPARAATLHGTNRPT